MSAQISDDNKTLTLGCDEGILRIHGMDQLSAPLLRVVLRASGGVRTIRFSTDSSSLALGQ
jgi:hypothetical protein